MWPIPVSAISLQTRLIMNIDHQYATHGHNLFLSLLFFFLFPSPSNWYSETCLERPLLRQTTCPEGPHIHDRSLRSPISIQLNLSPKTTSLIRERHFWPMGMGSFKIGSTVPGLEQVLGRKQAAVDYIYTCLISLLFLFLTYFDLEQVFGKKTARDY